MKAALILSMLVAALASSAQPSAGGFIGGESAAIGLRIARDNQRLGAEYETKRLFLESARRDRYRDFDGTLYDLDPVFGFFEENITFDDRDGWHFIIAKVVEIFGENGILLDLGQKIAESDRFIRLRNYPAQARVVDGSWIGAYVRADSTPHKYVGAITHAVRTVRSYNYGAAPSSELLSRYLQQQNDLAIAREKAAADQLQAAAIKQRAAAADTQLRVIEFQKRGATNGSPSAQYDLAVRYLTGAGVNLDRGLALHWLRSACTNGNTQASNLLTQIK